MFTGTNPFKKTTPQAAEAHDSTPEEPRTEPKAMESTAPPRTPGKLAPPAPNRRASSKKTSTLRTTSFNEEPAIAEEIRAAASHQRSGSTLSNVMDDADRDELDALERENQASQIEAEPDKDPSNPIYRRRSSSNLPGSITVPPSQGFNIGAPQINGTSTPRPFGDLLPTPDIVSRDLTKPMQEGGGRRTSVGGGVTSAGLVDPQQKIPIDAIMTKDRKRRPSTTGPILCALGCGTMGRSILSGVLDSLEEAGADAPMTGTKLLPPSRFKACVRRQEAAAKLVEEWGDLVSVVRGSEENARAVANSDYILLGCKPQVARDILSDPAMAAAIQGKVLISILAGTTITALQTLCPSTKIVRVMPNTPSRIRKGMSVIVPGSGVPQDALDLVSWIFNQVGKTLIMDEKHIDAATAMCGSGPAFMAVILESMTDGGVMMGIPRAQAEELAAQTMLGTASMVQAGQHPALIRNNVATPGGCTIGGLLEMEDGRIRSTMARTIQTATNIAAGLGK